jgi:hypothetical protein
MKAKNNKTGEIVTNFAISKEFGTISYFDSNKTLRFATACDNEWTIIDEESPFDWQSFRAEAAKDILCAIINCNPVKYLASIDFVVDQSVIAAGKLIERLN